MAEGDAALTCEQPVAQEERPYKCKQCPRSYRHAGSLVNHRRTHEVGLFCCPKCHKDFSNPMALKSHLRTHPEEKRHRCPDCGQGFRASSQLTSHRCAAPANQEQKEEEGSSVGSHSFQRAQDASTSAADACSGIEGNSRSLLTNLENYIAESVVPADFSLQVPIPMKAGHQERLPGQEEGGEEPRPAAAVEDERRYKCNQCDKAYKHAGSLTNHKQSHTLGVYQCAMCYKEFSNLMALRSHARLHSEYRPYKCRFCHKAFRLPSELLSHQKAHSQGESEAMALSAWEGSEPGVWDEDSIETLAKLDIYQPPPAGTDFGGRTPCSLKDAAKAAGGERCSPDGELCVCCGGTFASEEELKEHSCLYPEEGDEEEAERGSPVQRAPLSNGVWEASLKGEDSSSVPEERPFRCGDCGRTYRHAGSLINHKKSHQIGVYSCTVCSKQLYNLAALKNHLRVHLKSKLSLSPPEEASQHLPALLDSQKEQVSPGDCPSQPPDVWRGASCPKEEDDRGAGEEERPYRCEDCGRSYRHRGSLVNHRHTHQTGIFQCSICPKQYSNLMALRNHVRVHLRAARMRGRDLGSGLTCGKCGESFEEEAEFQLHQLRHLPCAEDIEVAEVPRLGVFYPQEAELLQAIRQDVEALENGAVVAEDILPDPEASHVCHQCGLAISSLAGLRGHISQHHSGGENRAEMAESTDSPVSTQRLYGCELCGKSYRHSGSLINHKQTHQTGDFSCSLCSKHFQNVASLKSHLRGHQRPRRGLSETLVTMSEDIKTEAAAAAMPGVLPLAEELGGGGTILEEDEDINGWQSESQVSSPLPGDSEMLPYLCEQCGLGFDQASSLIDHRQTHQTGIYQCSLCPKEYPSLLALKNHFHGHAKATASNHGHPGGEGNAEEKPFLCSLCGMIFPSEEGLQHHHNLLHEESETRGDSQDVVLKRETEEPLEDARDQEEDQLLSHICGYCGQTFDDMASLEEHSNGHLEEKAAALADTSIQLRRAPRVEEDQPPPPPPLAEGQTAAAESLDNRPYACGQCGKTYRHGGSLVNHKKIHLIGDYQCGICYRQYRNLSAYRNHLRNHPRCKLNGSVPQLRQPDPAGEGGLSCAYEKEDAFDGQTLKDEPLEDFQDGEDPPNNCCLASPVGEERMEQGAELDPQKTQEYDITGEAYEEEATQKAHGAQLFANEKEKEEKGAAGEENGPSAEEDDSSSERPFQCDVCGRSYKHAGSLINHKQTHKTGLFHCSICQKQFYNLMALKNHNRTHFETKRYRCSECPKAFRLQKQLASHQRVHQDRKQGLSLPAAQRHIRAKRAGKAENLTLLLAPSNPPSDPDDRPYRCGQCGRSYRHAGSLLNHQKSHKVGHFACASCGRAYPNLMSLKNHQRIHYEVKRHRCPDCGKAFKWQRQLQRHQRRPHPCPESPPGQEPERRKAAFPREQGTTQGEGAAGPLPSQLASQPFPSAPSPKSPGCRQAKKRFECSDCGKAYRAPRDLTHHRRRHQPERAGDNAEGAAAASKLLEEQPYKYNSCERTARHPSSLLNCKKARATGFYHCPTCQKSFCSLLALKNHLHTHKDKRRHRCPHCGKAFRTAKRLAIHAKGHGRSTEDGTFSCAVCFQQFFHRLAFQQHQLSHTSDDERHAREGSGPGGGS